MFGAVKQAPSRSAIAAAAQPLKAAVLSVAAVSAVVNLLALTGPLFMLQVYDRVLASRSVPTLIGLAVLAAGLFLFQAFLDVMRSRVLLRVGERFDRQLSRRIHAAVTRMPLLTRIQGDGLQPLRDLEGVRGFLAGSGPTALFDLPWMPVYLAICFLFHFWIGVTAVTGAIVLIGLTVLTDLVTRGPNRDAVTHGMTRNALIEAGRRNAETVRAMGLGDRLADRWQETNADYLEANRRVGDRGGTLGGISRGLRLMLQSTILGVGAWLVLQQEVTGGVMIASSVMMGRALAPVDLAIGNWRNFLTARQAWARLGDLFARLPRDTEGMALPAPTTSITTEGLAVTPPGGRMPNVRDVSLSVTAGSALGIIGPSGSGKSSLVRALVGAWAAAPGSVRLDGASLDQWNPRDLGAHIGYLPQGVELFDGTVADNIARFDTAPDPEAIVAAARSAGVHELIVHLEDGYDTLIGEGGCALSAGQRQRVGLARALYGDPFLVVLDEPNANLDGAGEAALAEAISAVRARSGIAIIVAHRPAVLSGVDVVLAMEAGRPRTFGPRDEVLSKVLKKRDAVNPAAAQSPAPFKVVANPSNGEPRENADAV